MQAGSPPEESYSAEETKRRFEAALRGAREVGHEPMKDIPMKRKTKARSLAEASEGIMIVYDVRTLPSGEVLIGKPYRRLPDGMVASLIAS
jgi:hypothetical protein